VELFSNEVAVFSVSFSHLAGRFEERNSRALLPMFGK
jgi:hypothetical protein